MTDEVELRLVYKGNGTWKEESSCNIGLAEQVRVFREVLPVLEADRTPRNRLNLENEENLPPPSQ